MGHWVPKEVLPFSGTKAEKEDDDPDSQPLQIHIQRSDQRAVDAKPESAWKLYHFSDDFSLMLQQIKGDQQCLWGLAYLQKDMGCVDPSQIPSPGVWNSTKSVSHCTETSRSLSRWAQLGTPGELCRTLSWRHCSTHCPPSQQSRAASQHK